MKVLKEMAIERADAIEICLSLGKKFIEHFHKLYNEGKNSPDFNHHCAEMQAWYDKCRILTLKNTKRKNTTRMISSSNLLDWFFEAGGSIDESNGFDSYEESSVYEDFMLALLANKGTTVKSVAEQILY